MDTAISRWFSGLIYEISTAGIKPMLSRPPYPKLRDEVVKPDIAEHLFIVHVVLLADNLHRKLPRDSASFSF